MRTLLAVACSLLVTLTVAKDANLVKLHGAVSQGAVCLDGSAPGYYFRPGADNSSWIVHLEGGGWCYNETLCLARSRTRLGSSIFWPATASFQGFLSDNQQSNPDFYNWNMAFVMYCDGASFAGNMDEPYIWNGSYIYFRGARILQAVLDNLVAKGMKDAESVILTGCSAGGLATYLHADFVHAFLPRSTKFAALADAGYFIDAPNVDGYLYMRELYQYVFQMQYCAAGVNSACIAAHSSDDQWKCFMAQYTYPLITSRFFVLNSQYDTWQLGNILQLPCTPPHCSAQQMTELQKFRDEFLDAAKPVTQSISNGAWLDSCLQHCQSLSDSSWTKLTIDGQSARDTFADWYFGRSGKTNIVDCAYPCNKCV